MMRAVRRLAILGAMALAACATGMGGTGGGSQPAVVPSVNSWSMVTREHVDLWLHGYALLTRDAAKVPVFRRGYRDSLEAVRHRANVLTALDANHEKLASLMAQNPEISNGQFLPLYFDSWDAMVQAINGFLRADGNVRDAAPADRGPFAVIASFYPTAQDREWLRLFTLAMGTESDQFYHAYWADRQRSDGGLVVAADSLWRTLRPRFQRFLTNTQQTDGQLVLSIVLGGEGRTANVSLQHNVIVVPMPASRDAIAEPVYTFAHEAVQTITSTAITDNTTPAQQRSGAANAYSPLAAVRGGAMLLQHVAPELIDGYMRFYLRQAGLAPPAGNPEAAFVAAFPLPSDILADMDRQIGNALGGI
jgi:hypothetical protein